jgi:hypothetical protein
MRKLAPTLPPPALPPPAAKKAQTTGPASSRIAAAFASASTSSLRPLPPAAPVLPASTVKLLYVTPEGLQSDRLLQALRQLQCAGLLTGIAVDEAHCISTWGCSFRPSYRALGRLRLHFPDTPILALTATATNSVLRDLMSQLQLPPSAPVFRSSFDRPNLRYSVVFKEAVRDPLQDLADHLREALGQARGQARGHDSGAKGAKGDQAAAGGGGSGSGGFVSGARLDSGPAAGAALSDSDPSAAGTPSGVSPAAAVVYTHKREECETLARAIGERSGLRVVCYHAGMGDADRSQAQEAWARGEASVCVATCAFGMGIDVAAVRSVCHFNLPRSLDAYYQEAGRGGRDGLPSTCRLYYCRRDRERMEFIIAQGAARKAAADAQSGRAVLSSTSAHGPDGEEKDPVAALANVAEYCEAATCRRVAILRHFGEKPTFLSCSFQAGQELCDVCLDPERARRQADALKAGTLVPPPNPSAIGARWGQRGPPRLRLGGDRPFTAFSFGGPYDFDPSDLFGAPCGLEDEGEEGEGGESAPAHREYTHDDPLGAVFGDYAIDEMTPVIPTDAEDGQTKKRLLGVSSTLAGRQHAAGAEPRPFSSFVSAATVSASSMGSVPDASTTPAQQPMYRIGVKPKKEKAGSSAPISAADCKAQNHNSNTTDAKENRVTTADNLTASSAATSTGNSSRGILGMLASKTTATSTKQQPEIIEILSDSDDDTVAVSSSVRANASSTQRSSVIDNTPQLAGSKRALPESSADSDKGNAVSAAPLADSGPDGSERGFPRLDGLMRRARAANVPSASGASFMSAASASRQAADPGAHLASSASHSASVANKLAQRKAPSIAAASVRPPSKPTDAALHALSLASASAGDGSSAAGKGGAAPFFKKFGNAEAAVLGSARPGTASAAAPGRPAPAAAAPPGGLRGTLDRLRKFRDESRRASGQRGAQAWDDDYDSNDDSRRETDSWDSRAGRSHW